MLMPEINITRIDEIKTILDFDERYTAPLHGFNSALEYYTKCSSLQFTSFIKHPTLIVNAMNDPFLSRECYPTEAFKKHSFVKFEAPLKGGHVGFSQFNKKGSYWSEERALHFIKHD